MKYSLSSDTEVEAAREYLANLIEKKRIVEIVAVSPRRSLNQNNYLHLLIGAFGNHFGYTMAEAKEIYKQLNKEVYSYKKHDHTFWKSSAQLTKAEMARTVDNFMKFSADNGYTLPPATDPDWMRQIENEIESSKYYFQR